MRNAGIKNLAGIMLYLICCFFCFATRLPAADYYVATNGSDWASGTSVSTPWRSLPDAVNRLQPGDRLYIRGGTYRTSVIMTNSGTASQRICIQAYNEEEVALKGSDIVTGWEPLNDYVWTHYVSNNVQQVFVDGTPLQQIGWPNENMRTNAFNCTEFIYIPYGHNCGEINPSTHTIDIATPLNDMVESSFYYNESTHLLYIWLPEHANPADHCIEVSTRKAVFYMDPGAAYADIYGITFKHNNTVSETLGGFPGVIVGPYSMIEHCTIEWCDAYGLLLRNNARAYKCNIQHNGLVGVSASYITNFNVAGCTIISNNYRNFTQHWSGGMKFIPASSGIVESNNIAYNFGSGIWFDTCDSNRQITIRNNHVHHNAPQNNAIHDGTERSASGIFIEWSNLADVYNNLVEHNVNVGIKLSGSANSRVFNNTIACTTSGIERGLYAIKVYNGKDRAPNTNNVIYNNLIYDNHTDYDMVISPESDPYTGNNRVDYNLIYRPVYSADTETEHAPDAGIIYPQSTFVCHSGTNSYTNLSAWTAATGWDVHSLSEDPRLRSYHAHLASNSPCINAGTNLSGMSSINALDQNPRIYDGTVDIGAYEFMPLPDFFISAIRLSRTTIVHDDENPQPVYGDPPPTQPAGRDRDARTPAEELHADSFFDPIYGDSVFTAYVTVENSGSDTGNGGLLRVWSDMGVTQSCGASASATQTIGSLDVGESREYTFNNLPVPTNFGSKTFRAFADSDCAAKEDNDTNNQGITNYTVLDPVPMTITLQPRTNSMTLHWTTPYLTGVSNNTVMIRWCTNGIPGGPDEGTLLYNGTNTVFTHSNLTEGIHYYYRIWVSDNGTAFSPPDSGMSSASQIAHLTPLQVLLRSSDTFMQGGKTKTRVQTLFFGDNMTAGIVSTSSLPDRFNLATKWTVQGAGNFNPAIRGDEVLLRSEQNYAIYLLYFDYTGDLHWEEDTNALCWTSYNIGKDYSGLPRRWSIDAIGDVNGDGQDELVMRNNYEYASGGKTKSNVKVLFYDDNSGRLRDQQPDDFSLATLWTIQGMGNFNKAPVAGNPGAAQELLIRHNSNGGFYLLYFDDNGELYWNADDTNDICWTSWSSGTRITNNATDWNLSAIGDVNGDGQDEILLKDSNTFSEGGKTKSWIRVLFFDTTNGQLRAEQPSNAKLSSLWSVAAMDNFCTTNHIAPADGAQILIQQVNNGGFYLLYLQSDGTLYWDADNTNDICWTSWSPGTDWATNASAWSVQAIGDFAGDRQ